MALAIAAVSGDRSSHAASSTRVGGLDRHERVGEAVADGLERGDGLAELDAFEGVLAGQRERRPRRADELVGDGELREGDGARSTVDAVRRRVDVDASP